MTIYDIAREAGVSASTVSRVINNKAGIKESTRKKVQKLLDEYNYTPDVASRSAGRWRTASASGTTSKPKRHNETAGRRSKSGSLPAVFL